MILLVYQNLVFRVAFNELFYILSISNEDYKLTNFILKRLLSSHCK